MDRDLLVGKLDLAYLTIASLCFKLTYEEIEKETVVSVVGSMKFYLVNLNILLLKKLINKFHVIETSHVSYV